MAEGIRLPGGHDQGAVRLGDRVQRVAGAWTPSVHHLLAFLAGEGFSGAPQPLGIDRDSAVPTAELTYLEW